MTDDSARKKRPPPRAAQRPHLELEPPARVLRGSVEVSDEVSWAGVVTLPEDGSGTALLTLTRHGPGEAVEATLVFPAAERPALALLIAGLAQA